MRLFIAAAAIAVLLPTAETPAAARPRPAVQWYEHDGQYFTNIRECRSAKRRAKRRGAVTGAVIAGAGAAAAGGRSGTVVAAGSTGAVVGREIGRNTTRC